jgi:single-strand DNA-binding protein
MSLQLNLLTLAGNLTRDPELKAISSGHVANFGLAINRRWKKDDGTLAEEVVFVDIEAWGKTAEHVGQYYRKGQGMLVEGRLKLDSWATVEGEKRQRLKVIAERVHFTASRQAAPGAAAAEGSPARAAAAPATKNGAPVDDEPPF